MFVSVTWFLVVNVGVFWGGICGLQWYIMSGSWCFLVIWGYSVVYNDGVYGDFLVFSGKCWCIIVISDV